MNNGLIPVEEAEAHPVSDIDPIDVWLKFDSPEDEEASHEANTFRTTDGYRVDWYHNDVGQVTSQFFEDYEKAQVWLSEAGYSDFSS
ncbi:hypothetical protein QEH42_gp138 [Microbacterium phage Pumpernickel]|uniref:Uncharacterized protein n=1 Tax=Microbacterium phage Pumpernickel TaxID=2885983 RepID=A0AAE8Y750_9CAUD|nr:hypothetical protein QEH42_gp029 [Microbacterium phage Pumpernickel]YP_010755320.1 hypothetical protein QEH42_gp138 [Microbacterium phage Pumpernickel]UDL15820.1 hypothetical protein SEA_PUMPERNICKEL_29 [Microbacterium phage Pumpernickel]UDL16080.1 hypothetical protein SEA_PUMPERNICKEL_330 [Microbacterium phage Pumpernickel]